MAVINYPNSVSAAIIGGDRDFNLLNFVDFTVDASASRNSNFLYDPNDLHLLFFWSCIIMEGEYRDGRTALMEPTSCEEAFFEYFWTNITSSDIRSPTFTSRPDVGEAAKQVFSSMLIKLTVCALSDEEPIQTECDYAVGDTTAINVYLGENIIRGTLNAVSIYLGDGINLQNNQINFGDKAVIEGTLLLDSGMESDYESLNYTWIVPAELNVATSISTPIDGRGIGLCQDPNSGSRCISLATVSGVLDAGRDYTFTLRIWQDNGLTISSSITINVNEPPTSGSISVSPLSGITLVTEFKFVALLWTDKLQDLPLYYS